MMIDFKRLLGVLSICASVLLCGCSSSNEAQSEQYVMTYRGNASLYENGVFYIVRDTIMYYSMEADTYIPVCTKPDCTHKRDTSPDCSALTNGAKGIVKKENNLYFFEPYESKLNLICSNLNGTGRRTVAVIEKGNMYMDYEYRYEDDFVLCVFYDPLNIEDMEEGDEYQTSPKTVSYVIKVDLNSGNVTELLKKKDYSATVYHAIIYENKLIYSYSFNTKDLSDEDDTEEIRKSHRQGIYSLDLNTGEDILLSRDFNVIGMLGESFDHFNPEKIICYSVDDEMIYIYNMNKDQFTPVDKSLDPSAYLAADYNHIIYKRDENDNEFCCYDLTSAETVKIPMLPNGMYLSGVDIVGGTVWIMYSDEDGIICRGYLNKEDFMIGNYDKFKFAHYINSVDGEK